MFTIVAFLAIAGLAWYAERTTDKERSHKPSIFEDDEVRQSVVFARQELRLIVYGIGAIVVIWE